MLNQTSWVEPEITIFLTSCRVDSDAQPRFGTTDTDSDQGINCMFLPFRVTICDK